MPEITVIVPVYKVEAYLDRCVSSILRQSFGDFSLILVDDGSPDNCPRLCDQYARQDSRVRVIHRENGGLSAARNSGIEDCLARGESQWLTFVDSDDWLHPDFLQLLHRAVRESDCLVAACGLFETPGDPITGDQDLKMAALSADDYYCGNYHGNGTPTACGKLYHHSLFATLRYPVGKLHEDEFTTYRALYAAGRVAATGAKLYAYFQNPNSITHVQWSPRRLHALEAFEEQIAFARQQGNFRLLNNKIEGYLYGTADQLREADADHRPMLRGKLRAALKLGRDQDCIPRLRDLLWAYELAYPCKPLWWLLGKLWR